MNRPARSINAVALPAPDVEIASWVAPWSRLLPLWRHAVWLAFLFAAFAISIGVRLDVQRTMKELDRNEFMQREASIQNERLRLERDARRRAVAMESVATELGLSPAARTVRISRARQ